MLSRCITHPLTYSSFSPCLVKVVGCRFISTLGHKALVNHLRHAKVENTLSTCTFGFYEPNIVENKEIAQIVHKSAIEVVNLEKSFEEGNSEFKHIVGYVPMPSLIHRLKDTGIDIKDNGFKFIIRKYYKHIYGQCNVEDGAFGIIGTPGIAKSVSLLYPLLSHFGQYKHSIADAPPILLHSCFTDDAHLFFNGSYWKVKDFMTETVLIRILSECTDLLYLADGPTPTKSLYEGMKGRTILASSPDRRGYKEFLKQGGSFIMPGWSLDEILESKPFIKEKLSDDEVIRRFDICGDIIKGVLTSQKAHDAYVKSLNRSIDLQKNIPNTAIDYIAKDGKLRSSDIGSEGPKFPHNIYHFTVDPDSFRTTHVKFASPFVTEMLGHIPLTIIHEKCKEILKSNVSNQEKGLIFKEFIENCFRLSLKSLIYGKINGETSVIGKSSRVHYSCKQNATTLITTIKDVLNDKYCDNQFLLLNLVERFKCLDFVTIDKTNGKKLVTLYQVTMNNDKIISPIDVEEYAPLLKEKDITTKFTIITSCKDYSTIKWKGSTDNTNKSIIQKWSPNMTIAFVDPHQELVNIVAKEGKEDGTDELE